MLWRVVPFCRSAVHTFQPHTLVTTTTILFTHPPHCHTHALYGAAQHHLTRLYCLRFTAAPVFARSSIACLPCGTPHLQHTTAAARPAPTNPFAGQGPWRHYIPHCGVPPARVSSDNLSIQRLCDRSVTAFWFRGRLRTTTRYAAHYTHHGPLATACLVLLACCCLVQVRYLDRSYWDNKLPRRCNPSRVCGALPMTPDLGRRILT